MEAPAIKNSENKLVGNDQNIVTKPKFISCKEFSTNHKRFTQWTYNEVKDLVEFCGYTLVTSSSSYKYNTTLDMVCMNGHECSILFRKFKEDVRCSHPNCIRETRIGKATDKFNLSNPDQSSQPVLSKQGNKDAGAKFISATGFMSKRKKGTTWTYPEVKQLIEYCGYKLKSNEYKDYDTKLLVECPKGHQFEICLDKFVQDRRCSNKQCVKTRIQENSIDKFTEAETIQYKPKRSPKESPKFISSAIFIKNRKKIKWEIAEVKSLIESCGYKLLSENYDSYRTELLVVCPNNHTCKISLDSFVRDRRCSHPSCMMSKAMASSYRTKIYTFPSGRKNKIQGYENWALDFLLASGIDEDDILLETDRPIITYVNSKGRLATYYPDIYIESLNLIIEVKSNYTYDQDDEINYKMAGTVRSGYNVYLCVYDKKGRVLLEEDYPADQ